MSDKRNSNSGGTGRSGAGSPKFSKHCPAGPSDILLEAPPMAERTAPKHAANTRRSKNSQLVKLDAFSQRLKISVCNIIVESPA